MKLLAVYAAPLLTIWLLTAIWRRRKEALTVAAHTEEVEAGLTEPASLHPVIDPVLCLGCAACVRACPEGDILGLIGGKAALIAPTQCIGHGACKVACPTGAITLVFGTETRGIELPLVDQDFQTNVPGLFIAGELGGMGLIRNAIEQGRQAMDSIGRLDGLGRRDRLDVVIVGAGPAGISASLAALEKGLSFATLEQDSFGGTVAHFPRSKLVMTGPATMPIIGQVRLGEISKEDLLAFWERISIQTGLQVTYDAHVSAVLATADGFEVQTQAHRYPCRAVLLAIGRRGTPRKLDVPGEELAKVVYRLVDPAQYRGQHVLVVGGGDSALEAAASLAEEPGTMVTLSYRSEAFSRAKTKNRQRVAAAESAGNLEVLLKSSVRSIEPDRVAIEHQKQSRIIRNDAVIVCAGGILPTSLLRSMGVEIETKFGTA